MNKLHIFILNIILLVVVCSSCTDELEYDGGGLIDGSERDISITIAFEPNDEKNLGSRSNPGNSIEDIRSLRMLIYDKDGNLAYNYLVFKDSNPQDNDNISNVVYDGKSDNRTEDEKENNYQDAANGKLSFDLKLKTGKYYIFAVANIDDITDDQMSTKEKLKAISRQWNPSDLAANSEMFGIFDKQPNRNASERLLPITVSTASLHCWLRRLASKVTVAFDGSELFDNVQVFVENIAIHDIPRSCLLGRDNEVGYGISNTDRATVEKYVYPIGDTIFIQNVHDGKTINSENYLHVCNNSHRYLGKGQEGNSLEEQAAWHAHTARSLFFYENMQGEGKDKRQDANGDNHLDRPGRPGDEKYLAKDGKPFGTYIEVSGWYRCTSPDQHVDEGPIKYRFMLGKNNTTDYNAERNTHYRLTLRFKGYGNDADWHIEYESQRSIQVTSPLYISYLFNKKMMANIKVKGKMDDSYRLKAEIKNCSWKPWGDGSPAFPMPKTDEYTQVATSNDGPWNSFLSLSQTNVVKVEVPGFEGAPSNLTDFKTTYNKTYYTSSGKGERLYNVKPSQNGYDSNDKGAKGTYFVSETSNDGTGTTERLFTIPLFTRAKELITSTGFTGNNPFSSYPRHAQIELSVVDAAGKTVAGFDPVTLDIIQVRRIINPKGVWRRSGNTEPFHVTLARLPHLNSDAFEEFASEGKWSAEVLYSSSPIISLSSTEKGSGGGNRPQTMTTRIEGESECPIDFWINFNGNDGCAIVKVRYHNFTCEHDIFCRTGYDPIDITGKGEQWWPSYNVAYFDGKTAKYTKSPLEEGALFRRGNYTAILASNNHKYGLGVEPGALDVIKSDGTRTTSSWNGITPTNGTSTNDEDNVACDAWQIDNADEHIARCSDFYTMVAENANDITFNISKAYGVLYGDGATETQMSTEKAFGYDRTDGVDDPRGMRGVFVYNTDTKVQLFFPIGFSGHGHRKSKGGWRNNDPDGALRYASRSDEYGSQSTSDKSNLAYLPLFFDLYKRPGAIYWTERFYNPMPQKNYTIPDGNGGTKTQAGNNAKKSSAFDMNFFTMGFEGYSNDAVPSVANSHGCFIRTVRTKAGPSGQ